MGRVTQYTTAARVLNKLERDFGTVPREVDVIEWTAEALEFTRAPQIMDQRVAFLEVKNKRAVLPSGLCYIRQVARNNSYEKWVDCDIVDNLLCPAAVLEEATATSDDAEATIQSCYLDCDGTPITEYDIAYYRPYFDLVYEYEGWVSSSYYKANYTPVMPSSHSFFESVSCPVDTDLYKEDVFDEYSIDSPYISLSFKEGSIAIAYLGTKLGEDGYPAIPDDASHLNAIVWYIMWKVASREFFSKKQGSRDTMLKAEAEWNHYCAQASTKNKMLVGEDEHQAFMDSWSRLLPKRRYHTGFFGMLTKAENRIWNNPNKRFGRSSRIYT